MSDKYHEIVVVGGGAAGLMAAITAARQGRRVLILDSKAQLGAKILMSGGTRCNLTNKAINLSDYNSHQLMRVRHVLSAFDNKKVLNFFKSIGVEAVLEPTGKYFPEANSAKSVLSALLKECARLGVEIKLNCRVTYAASVADGFELKGKDFDVKTAAVVLSTGGLSYPGTGSDGTGYRLAAGFGHQQLPTTAALTPLTTSDAAFKALSGVALPVVLMFYAGGKKRIEFRDDFLFTHLGFSGPAALDISRHWENASGEKKIIVNFLPAHDEKSFDDEIIRVQSALAKKTIRTYLSQLLPERLVVCLLKKAKIDEKVLLNQLTVPMRRALVKGCIQHELAITGVVGYSKAEVTAGGLDLTQVNTKNMQSTLVPGLFFAGEMMDVDGRIGGFNFQWAWSSGYVAGFGASEYIEQGKHSKIGRS